VFDKLLIANRGEIACRIMRTAKRLGIRTVAIYSDADASALHVALADEAHRIGPAAPEKSYLSISAILAAARRSEARALHPGYGFLAENSAFAEACDKAGVRFVGPPAEAIRLMGSKAAARAAMEQALVPVLPGYHEADQGSERLQQAANEIGYPVLIKPSAGGGGKGLRVVTRAQDFARALAGARREAHSAFGDDRVLIERLLNGARHIEVQIFADAHGNVVHLFERDCSIQRRYQKVLEETPAPGITPGLRSRLGAAATDAARAVGYLGAGTVEFLLDPKGAFYFIEMNTRLQVEHPVTEMITGQDLVEWQLLVAAGEPLPRSQEQLSLAGHAIEARLYAEDPKRNFLPSPGTVRYLCLPEEHQTVRVDTGVRAGDRIAVDYDHLLAKLIVLGNNRSDAIRRLQRSLADCRAAGLATNLAFLTSLARHPNFRRGAVDVGFVQDHREELSATAAEVDAEVLALACLSVLLDREEQAKAAARRSGDPFSPWHTVTGWRLHASSESRVDFELEGKAITVTARSDGEHFQLDSPLGSVRARGTRNPDGELLAELGEKRIRCTVFRHDETLILWCGDACFELTVRDPDRRAAAQHRPGGQLTAPMPGKIVAVYVEPGTEVKRGEPLLVLEAMKMEHTVAAPANGTVAAIRFRTGERVSEGDELVDFTPATDRV
jgi:3-methylcrotonyl-CoA carboxylase alpha subunit